MKYIIKPGSKLYNKLERLKFKMKKANDAQYKFLSKFGREGGFYVPLHTIAGGVEAICFEENPDPKLWKKFRNGYSPKKSAKKLLEEFNSLPVVKNEELNNIINFKRASFERQVIFRPEFCMKDDYFLISINSEINYTPVEGMEEILDSEYKELAK